MKSRIALTSPRDRTGQGSKTGGIAVAVAGSGEYFSLPAQLLLPTVPPIVQRGPLNVFPFLLLAYCRLQSERADETPFTAGPGLACRRPTAIHTYCAYILSTHCSDCMQCAARLLAAGCWLPSHTRRARVTIRAPWPAGTQHTRQPTTPSTHPPVRPPVRHPAR